MKRRAAFTVILYASALLAGTGARAQTTCTPESSVSVNVVALDQILYLNRFGANLPGGMMFALARDVVSESGESCYPDPLTQCKPGRVRLREGKRPRPIVLRANEGDCLQITFTNLLSRAAKSVSLAGSGTVKQPTTRKASIHVQGLPWQTSSTDDGSFVGANASSLAEPGGQAVYKLIAEREGSYLLYSMGDNWSAIPTGFPAGQDGGQLTAGLFGSMNVQPSGYSQGEDWASEWYRSQVTEQDLCLASADGKYDPARKLCTRQHPNDPPVINYDALYPDDYADPSRAGTPILNMLCTGKAAKRKNPETGQPACVENELVHSDLTAIVTGPGHGRYPNLKIDQEPPDLRAVYVSPDRLQPYREFTIIYHESFEVFQAFQQQFNEVVSIQTAADNFGINYGMGGLASEVLANRLNLGPGGECTDCKYEEFFLSSWVLGDPAMNVDVPASACASGYGFQDGPCRATKALFPDDPSNVYHSYMSDHTKFRVLHAGPDLHHLHHQHAHQWLGTPNSPNGDYLDSQSIGPASSFTMEMVYNGSGNVNQTVGDSIFHCHFYPHFASGMWSLWRVHDVFEGGTILGPQGRPRNRIDPATNTVIYTRALPDGEIASGTPIPALVPLPTLPMAPQPASVRLQGVCSQDPTVSCFRNADCGKDGGLCEDLGSRYCVNLVLPKTGEECVSSLQQTEGGWRDQGEHRNPGYPFFIPGVAGSRAPHPPLDFAYACSGSGEICSPVDAGACKGAGKCEALDGGLRRHLITRGGEAVTPPLNNTDFSKELEEITGIALPEDGTLVEKVAMATHARRYHDSQLPDGRATGICSDNKAPCTADTVEGRQQCDNPFKATCDKQGQINFILNGLDPAPGAPYADPCILFRRQGGQPEGLLTRRYLAADIQLDTIFNKEGWHFPQQRILSLWGDVKDTMSGSRAPEPLFMRTNSNDCIDYVLANLVPNVYELDDFQVRTPTDIIGQHIHLVKFDVTSSDGSGNGWNYEDGTFGPNEVTERINALNDGGGLYPPPGSGGTPDKDLKPKFIKYFGKGPGGAWLGSQATLQRWYSDPLFNNRGVCSTDVTVACTLNEMQNGVVTGESPCPGAGICVSSAGVCADNGKACTAADLHLCGSRSTSCIPSYDRTLRTVFTHDHFGPSTHQQAGLYAGLVVEPRESLWLDNQTGAVMGGFDAKTGKVVQKRFDGGPTSWQAVIQTASAAGTPPAESQSFREFLFEIQDSTLIYLPFDVGRNPFENQRPGVCADADQASQPCGFCAYSGVCVDSATGELQLASGEPVSCTVTPPDPLANPPVKGDVTECPDPDTAVCRLDRQYLVSCTPTDLSACTVGPESSGVIQSCNFVTGVPSTSWQAGNPIGDPLSNPAIGFVEAITFNGATNNFSFNYRNEPLYPRTTDPTTGNPVPGQQGDLGFAYASLDRPYLPIGFCNPYSVPCRFCSDNGAACKPGDLSKCANPQTAVCGPYPPLTVGVGANDPFTPLLRAYAKDDVQIRPLIGAHINPHNFTLHGLKWLLEPSFVDSGWRNSEVMGISEHFELITRIPPPLAAPSRQTAVPASADYLYKSGAAAIEQASGNWGLVRAYNQPQKQLQALPQNPPPQGGFASVPICPDPQHAPRRPSTVVALTVQQALGNQLVYNERQGIADPQAILFFSTEDPALECSDKNDPKTCISYSNPNPEPLVLRAAAGDCLTVDLYNNLPAPSTGLCADGTTSCQYGTVCSDGSICQIYGYCAGAATKSCTPANAGTQCGVTCDNGVCSNNSDLKCSGTDVSTCKACLAILGLGVASLQPTQTAIGPPPPIALSERAEKNVEEALAAMAPTKTARAPELKEVQLAAASPLPAERKTVTGLSVTSLEVGLRPQLVTYDPLSSDGFNAGNNPVQTAGPGEHVTYTWYAGNLNPAASAVEERYIPIEFGAANLMTPDPFNQYKHALFAGLIIEPRGSTWELEDNPATGKPSPTRAVVRPPLGAISGEPFREFVVFTQDALNPPVGAGAAEAINYKSEYLFPSQSRFCSEAECEASIKGAPQQDLSCYFKANAGQQKDIPYCSNGSTCQPCEFQPETPTFQACAGEEVRFRLLHPGGTNTDEVFELAGHNFLESPYMTPPAFCEAPTTHTNLYAAPIQGIYNLCGSSQFTSRRLATGGLWSASLNEWKGSRAGHGPGNHFDILIDLAGGPNMVPGDYLYRSAPAFHFNLGMWGIFRVADREKPPQGLTCIEAAKAPMMLPPGSPAGSP